MLSNNVSDRIVAVVIETDRKSDIMSVYESETIELKEVYTPEIKKEVVEFANTNGGAIYILVFRIAER